MPSTPPRRPLRLNRPPSGGIGLEWLQSLLASRTSEALHARVLAGLLHGLKGVEQALLWVKDGHRRFQLVAAEGLPAGLVRGLEGVSEAALRGRYGSQGWPEPSLQEEEPHPLRVLLGERLPPGLSQVDQSGAVLTLPITAEDEVWVVVQLWALEARALGPEARGWAAEYLGQAGPVLREFHLRERAERQALWLAAINALLRAPREQALEVTLQDALEEITRLSGAEGARLVLLEEGVRSLAQAGWGAGVPVEAAIGPQLVKLAQRGEQVSIPHYELYPGHQAELVKAGLRSLFLLPIQRETQEGAALLLFSTRTPWLPDAQTQALLLDMAAAIGVVRREWTLQRELAWAAYTDPLTGLGNRRAFERDLAHLSAKNYGRTVVLVLLDLDGFKGINDTYGHVHADHVLIRLGGALRAKARAGDRAYRLGGDEFALIIEGPQSLNPARTAERYRALFEEVRVSDSEYLRASLGYAVLQDVTELNQLWREADDAMYRDKAMRRTQTPLFALPQGRASVLQVLSTPLARVARRLGYAAGLLPEELEALMAACFVLEQKQQEIEPLELSEGEQRAAARILSFLGARWDGHSMPGVKGEHIPKTARILALASELVKLLRPARGHPLPLEEALRQVEVSAGSRFDPGLVELLLRLKNELGLEDSAA